MWAKGEEGRAVEPEVGDQGVAAKVKEEEGKVAGSAAGRAEGREEAWVEGPVAGWESCWAG